ncbi:peroxiredoxin family protein [Paludisphaera mucosa]|uniref:thioredoxin-dependent peroxiredoxin n=1 Tax=Paludisphaera mucosa TaxID=3030827 RepID=A0ABT6FBU0_9BACT|nr:peroxiredoxin family protein [Paludisphaera mucosa]MDG3005058.1 peroxiredoxin family protein [Paludisphaera mucosa]
MSRRPFFGSILAFFCAAATCHAAPPREGESAADFTLKTLADEPVRLKTLLERGPVVLVVLRGWPGYQCPICTAQVRELVRESKTFEARKARVVLVYPGPADGLKAHAAEFERGKGLPDGFQLVMDPDYDLTKSYDLRWDAPGETAYPSTFVIDREGKVVLARVSRSHGGRAKAGEILEALK